jgi:hypothetical protein
MRSLRQLRAVCALIAAITTLVLSGCHRSPASGEHPGEHQANAFEITIRNEGPDIHQLEVDYPSASFGQDFLASGASYHYYPKIIGSGPVKVTFNDVNGKSHTATGPVLQEGLRKELVIVIGEGERIDFQELPAQGP